MNWTLRALWLVVAYDLLEYRHTAPSRHRKVVCIVLSNMADSFEIIPEWESKSLERS